MSIRRFPVVMGLGSVLLSVGCDGSSDMELQMENGPVEMQADEAQRKAMRDLEIKAWKLSQ